VKAEERQKFLIVLTIVVVGLVVGERFIYEPLANWWKARSDKIASLRELVKNGKALTQTQREQGIRSRWDEMRTNTLPINTSLADQEVQEALNRWKRDSGVSINGLTPQWKNDTEDYMTLNCRVEASGDLAMLSRFLYEIEKDPMALKLDSVELGAQDKTGQQLQLGLQISGLVLIPTKKP
jgi:Tfp pilus assembly protein PilO